jgi:two-component system response regulator FixJ
MHDPPVILVVDDDQAVRGSLEALLLAEAFDVRTFASAEALASADIAVSADACLLDIRMPGKDGLALLADMAAWPRHPPVIIMTGHGDIPMAVKAMKLGATDFIEKPFDPGKMLTAVRSALSNQRPDHAGKPATDPDLQRKLGRLTPRERDVLEHLVAGRSNKEAALKLGISPRTVEIHRARLMEKMAATSLAQLVRLALEAGIGPDTT